MDQDPWRLDPSRFPKKIDLDLSDEAIEVLERLSARTGRSVRDIAADLLCQAVADQEQNQA